MRKKFILMLVCACGIFSMLGCQPGTPKEKAEADEVIPVEAVRIIPRDIFKSIDYIGNIKAQDEIEVYPKVSGKIIEKVKVEGENVEKGESIAYIDRDEVGLTFEKAPVESPLSGVVGRVYVDIGTSVTPQSAVALVVNIDMVKIYMDIPEIYLPQISLGQEARITLDAYPDQDFLGRVVKISPVVDIASRTASIEISVDNKAHRLKPGMFARVELILAFRKGVPVILKEALVGRDAHASVYVVEGRRVSLRQVTLGLRQGPYYEIASGLKEGDLVVVVGQQRLYEGAAVNVEEREE